MSNKKKRNLKKKLAKKKQVQVLAREQVTIIGQAALFVTGTTLGAARNSHKAKGVLTKLLNSGQVIKVGSLFVIKKITALLFIVSGLALIFGFYRKKKSHIPIAKHQAGVTTFFPGLFSKPIKLSAEQVVNAEYKEYKYVVKIWVKTIETEKAVVIKFSTTDINVNELIPFFKRYVTTRLTQRQSFLGM